jgi:hypothetical protein
LKLNWLLQIPDGYMQPIALLKLVSNHRPEKSGFGAIKWTNPLAQIHPAEFGYHQDIQNGF